MEKFGKAVLYLLGFPFVLVYLVLYPLIKCTEDVVSDKDITNLKTKKFNKSEMKTIREFFKNQGLTPNNVESTNELIADLQKILQDNPAINQIDKQIKSEHKHRHLSKLNFFKKHQPTQNTEYVSMAHGLSKSG